MCQINKRFHFRRKLQAICQIMSTKCVFFPQLDLWFLWLKDTVCDKGKFYVVHESGWSR